MARPLSSPTPCRASSSATRSCPHFKQDPPDYGGGIIAGADQIIKQMSLPAAEAQKPMSRAAEQAQRERRDDSPGFIPVMFWMFVIIFVIGSMAAARCGTALSRPQRQWRDQPVGHAVGPQRAQPRLARQQLERRRLGWGGWRRIELAAAWRLFGRRRIVRRRRGVGVMVMQLTEADHAKVSAAIAAAEAAQQWRDRRRRDPDQRQLSRCRAALGGAGADPGAGLGGVAARLAAPGGTSG